MEQLQHCHFGHYSGFEQRYGHSNDDNGITDLDHERSRFDRHGEYKHHRFQSANKGVVVVAVTVSNNVFDAEGIVVCTIVESRTNARIVYAKKERIASAHFITERQKRAHCCV